MDYKKIVELIFIKEKNLEGITVDSRVKSKLRNYGNKLVNDTIDYLKDSPSSSVLDEFPEYYPEAIKYIHEYIMIKDVQKEISFMNEKVKRMKKDMSKENKALLKKCSDSDIDYLLKLSISMADAFRKNLSEYKAKFTKLAEVESNSALRLYIVTDDNMPNLSASSSLSKVFIGEIFIKIISDVLIDTIEPNDMNTISVCTVIDEALRRIPKKSKSDDYNFEDGYTIKNNDGSIRGYYFDNRSRYLQ